MNRTSYTDESSTSGYLTEGYEGLSTTFTDIERRPSRGYCELYRAKRYGRWFLLKCLTPEHQGDEAYRQMLRKELEVLMRLQHPGLMMATGMETVALPGRGATMCMVAEWIDGTTLSDYLQTEPPVGQLRRIAMELAEAVAYVHQQQVVHRDLKPSNVMVTHNGGYVKLIDFGLADTDSHAILKQPAGTLRYMAPEQQRLAAADVRNDVYSLGIILQEMNRMGRVVPGRIINRCLAPIDQRWPNADALVEALRQSNRRRRLLTIAAGVALATVIIAVLGWQIRHLQQKASGFEDQTAQMERQLRVLRHEIIDFEDEAVRRKCIAHWDSDHDGELSYAEAQAVTSLGEVFTGDCDIMYFDELQHFTGLTAISRNAFCDCKKLQSIAIPRSVRFFQKNAFRRSGLPMLSVPSTVVGIGDHCMDDCPRLQTVIFESMLPATNEGIVPLQGCPQLSYIFVPEYEKNDNVPNRLTWKPLRPLMKSEIEFADPEVKAICLQRWDRNHNRELSISEAQAVAALDAAFCRNPIIKHFDELRFFTGLEEIGISDFEECLSLQSIQLPQSIRRIGAWAFHSCKRLQHMELPERLERIDHDAFGLNQFSSIFIPAATTSIATTAVSENYKLTQVTVSPDNPVYDSRENCNAIIHTATNCMISASHVARIPRSIASLSDEAFNWFYPEDLFIPDNITYIGPWTFATWVDRVYLESPTPPYYDSQNGQLNLFEGDPDPEIYVPIGSSEAYKQADGWRQFAHRIREYPVAPHDNPGSTIAALMRQALRKDTWP